MEHNTRRVLVVDDEPTIAHLVRASLMSADIRCDVEYCSDGIQGLARATEGRYDLITLDRNMPRMGGLDTLKAIRRNRRSADTPVVMITAQKDQQFERHAIELGAAAVISKPFRPQQLATILRAVLSRDRTDPPVPEEPSSL
jgi:DNA-binding response OmpR family regulator